MDLKQIDEARSKARSRAKAPKVFQVREDFLTFGPYTNHLLYHEGQKMFYQFKDDFYQIIADDELMSAIDRFCVETYATNFDATTHNIKEVFKALVRHASTNTYRKVSPSFAPRYSTFQDKIFDFVDLTTIPISKDVPSFHKLNFPFPSKPIATPSFDKYLSTTFVTSSGAPDKELQDFMISVLAFYISPLNTASMGVILTGAGSNGKSVFLDLLRAIVGSIFISSITMESLSSRFGPSALVGKKLNVVSEDQSKYINAGKIKALISQEYIEIERKFQDPGSFRPTAKHIFSTNKDVKFEDVDFATTRRIAVIPFFRTFVSPKSHLLDGVMVVERDKELIKNIEGNFSGKLVDEMPGILHKLIARLQLFDEDGYEIEFPTAVKATQKEIESSSTNAMDFFHRHYIYDTRYKGLVSTEEIYEEYQTWFRDEHASDKYLMTSRNFWSVIGKNFVNIKTDKKTYSSSLGKTTAAKRYVRPTAQRIDTDGIPFIE